MQLPLTLIPVAVAGLLTVLGWWAVNRLAESREKKNKARELRLQYLAKACRTFSRVGLEKQATPHAKDLEEAVSDIYLFGTDQQIAMVRVFVAEFAERQSANMNALIKSLRDELRAELGLRPILEEPQLLRIELKKKPSQAPDPTITAVTLPAAAGNRDSGDRGSS